MELIERYLQAVGFWLPKQGKEDILAELSEDIHAQIEERERAAGRNLSEDEIKTLLKERGRPMVVANAYQPKRYLIGPLLFPVYTFVLKVVALCYLVPTMLVWLGLVLSPGWLASHGSGSWFAAAASVWAPLWTTAFTALGIVTVVFAVLERTRAVSRLFTEWDPGKLPKVRMPNRISRNAAIFELAMMVLLVVWWVTTMASPTVVNRGGVQVVFTPLWHNFFWELLAVFLGSAGLAAANVVRPYWTPARAMLRLLLGIAGSVFFCWFVQADIVSRIVISTQTPERCLAITKAVNAWAARCLPMVIIAGIVIAAVDVFRVVRVVRAGRGYHGRVAINRSGYSA